MATYGKNINLFLMDGVANGRIKCTLANWTGVAYKIPRTAIDQCKDRSDLKQSGVYFLFGNSDQIDEKVVYVGQAGVRKNTEGILCRLKEHRLNADKDYWTEAVVFTTSNNSFGPTDISYLENRFYTLARNANRYTVKNENEPTQGNLTEEKRSELEEFITYAKTIMGVLGYPVFDSLLPKNDDNTNANSTAISSDTLYIDKTDAHAICQMTNDACVVLKGSTIRLLLQPSCPNSVKTVREKYASIIDKNGTLLDNIPFKSPSGASSFILGASTNGFIEWKNKEGKTLKELENQ